MTIVTMNFRGELHAYLTWAKAAGHSPSTIKLRRIYLTVLSHHYDDRPLLKLTQQELVAFLATDGWAPETRRTIRSCIRSFYTWAVDAELIDRDPSAKLPRVYVPQALPRPTPKPVVASAFDRADERLQRMLILAHYAGLRRAEIARLHTSAFDGQRLTIRGKGGRVRRIPAHDQVIAALTGLPEGWVFPNGHGSHLSVNYVGGLLSAHLGAGWTAHTLRHAFASNAFSFKRDMRTVQMLLGHASITTTQRYVEVPDDALVEAVRAIA